MRSSALPHSVPPGSPVPQAPRLPPAQKDLEGVESIFYSEDLEHSGSGMENQGQKTLLRAAGPLGSPHLCTPNYSGVNQGLLSCNSLHTRGESHPSSRCPEWWMQDPRNCPVQAALGIVPAYADPWEPWRRPARLPGTSVPHALSPEHVARRLDGPAPW